MSKKLRPHGYYWVRSPDSEPEIAHWDGKWAMTFAGPDFNVDGSDATVVLLGPLHLHCYSRSCLRGSGACGRASAEAHPETFVAAGCECDCAACDAGRGALNWTEEKP